MGVSLPIAQTGSRTRSARGGLLPMLDPDDRSVLLRLGAPRRFGRGSSIIFQGDHGDSVFIVVDGRVKVAIGTIDGREIVLAILGPGDLLGEFEAIDGRSPRTAANVAIEPVQCLAMPAEEFLRFVDARPQVAIALLRVVAGRLRCADRRRVESSSLDTAHRLARLVLELAVDHGRPAPRGIDIDLPLTQSELASLIAASRDSVVRALGSLRRHGLIATARGSIAVCDVDGLRRFAD